MKLTIGNSDLNLRNYQLIFFFAIFFWILSDRTITKLLLTCYFVFLFFLLKILFYSETIKLTRLYIYK